MTAVSAGFPHGLSPLPQRIDEVRASVAEGATEIDVVIMRAHALTGNWEALFEEVRAFREACGDARLKTILATGELRTLETVARASLVCMMAGADFLKTSTGKDRVNATLHAGFVMADAIRDYRERTGISVGLKPAGGIRTAGLHGGARGCALLAAAFGACLHLHGRLATERQPDRQGQQSPFLHRVSPCW